jgi:RNA recognition motif-containing protein
MVYSPHVRNISSYFTNHILRFYVSRRAKEVFFRIWQGKLCYVAPLCVLSLNIPQKVDACTIMRDPETGRSRGFAFLTFEEPSSVNAVMVREHYLDGKAVRHLHMSVKLIVTTSLAHRLTQSARFLAKNICEIHGISLADLHPPQHQTR